MSKIGVAQTIADRLAAIEALAPGTVILRLRGKESGSWALLVRPEAVAVSSEVTEQDAEAEISGDAERILAVFQGRVTAMEAIRTGDLGISGNIDYIIKAARALKMLP
jgi:hypothetical protein